MRPLRSLATFGRLFVPPQCPACHGRVGGAGLCSECADAVSLETAAPISFPLAEDAASTTAGLALGPYSGAWREVVLAFKKDPVPAVRAVVEERVARGVLRLPGAPGWIVPVPMAPVRRRERGWNPPEVVASMIAAAAGGGCACDWLERVRYGGTLAAAGRAERSRELRGAIRARGGARLPQPGADVLLVDDVVTTGATMEAAALALLEAGAGRIFGFALARTP